MPELSYITLDTWRSGAVDDEKNVFDFYASVVI
jgi:hypothetical protein